MFFSRQSACKQWWCLILWGPMQYQFAGHQWLQPQTTELQDAIHLIKLYNIGVSLVLNAILEYVFAM